MEIKTLMRLEKSKINVCLLAPAGEIHAIALLEAAQYVVSQTRAAGYEATLTKNRIVPDGLNILFGAHIHPKNLTELPENVVIFNTEQLSAQSVWTDPAYTALLQRHFVWDYSAFNLGNIAPGRSRIINFCYSRDLDRLTRVKEPEHDLIFYGSMNERRQRIIEKIRASCGLNLKTVFGIYGPERDSLLCNARAVLNLHFYDTQIFQQVRAFYALTNGIPVISENFPYDSASPIFRDVVFTPGAEALETYVGKLFANQVRFKDEAERRIGLFRAVNGKTDFQAALEDTLAIVLGGTTRSMRQVGIPVRMNLGSGKDYRAGYLNLDVNPSLKPDVLLDLATVVELPVSVESPVYGEITLKPGQFEEILAIDVLEHVQNLRQLMTNCLQLLKEGGRLAVLVPYDLSLGAWQDPTHVRAFNENSWQYYTDWFWYLGWFEYRFDCIESTLNLSELGKQLAAANVGQLELLRTPRAVDSMQIVLSKRKTSPEEKTLARSYGNDLPDPG